MIKYEYSLLLSNQVVQRLLKFIPHLNQIIQFWFLLIFLDFIKNILL